MAENSLWELACRPQALPQPQIRLFSNGPGCQPHFTDAKQHARPIRGCMQGAYKLLPSGPNTHVLFLKLGSVDIRGHILEVRARDPGVPGGFSNVAFPFKGHPEVSFTNCKDNFSAAAIVGSWKSPS